MGREVQRQTALSDGVGGPRWRNGGAAADLLPLPVAGALAAGACAAAGAALLAPVPGLPLEVVAALLAAGAAATVVVPRPRLALVLLVVVVVARLGSVLARFGVPAAYLAVFSLGAASALWGLRRGRLRLRPAPVLVAALLLLVVQALSVLGARDVEAGLSTWRDVAEAMLFLVVLVVLASAPGGVRVLALAAAGTVAVLAGLSVAQEYLLAGAGDLGGLARVGSGPDLGGVTSRHSGPADDPNVWGRNLVLLLPVALALAVDGTGRERAAWSLASAALLGGVVLTQSRGALLATAAGLAAWVVLGVVHRRRAVAVALLGLALALAVPGVGSRLATVGQAGAATDGSGDPSLVGRVEVLRHGIAMFHDHPVLGLGVGGFLGADAEYRLRTTTYAHPLEAHNLYVELLAETGVLGTLAWLLLLGTTAWTAVRAGRRLRGTTAGRQAWERTLPAAVVSGLLAWSVASVFLHLAELRVLLVLVALAVGLDDLAQQRSGEPPVPLRWSERAWSARALVPVVVVTAGTALAVAPFLEVRQVRWEARMVARVVPALPTVEVPYVHDVATRPFLSSTYAAVANALADSRPPQAGVRTTVAASAREPLVTAVTTAPSQEAARSATGEVLTGASAVLARTGSAYRLEPTAPSAELEAGTVLRRDRLAGSALTGALAGVAVAVARRRRDRQSQEA